MLSYLRRFSDSFLGSNAERAARLLGVGPSAGLRVVGSPALEIEGTVVVGRSVVLRSGPAVTRIAVGEKGTLILGDEVEIERGCVLAAEKLVAIGPRTELGPYVFIVDSNIGDPDLPHTTSAPIIVGPDVQLGSRVTLLKGARIGAGARITAGSVVASAVSPGAVVEGNPGRIVGTSKMCAAHEPLLAQAWVRPDATAIITDTGSFTYAVLWQRVSDIARALIAQGVGSEAPERVLVWARDPSDFIASIYGVWLAGGTAVPVPEGAAPRTLEEMALSAEARFLLVDVSLRQALPLELTRTLPEIIELERVPPHVEHVPFSTSLSGRSLSDPALILFTSGTTAKKKAVLLSHGSLLSATQNINAFMQQAAGVREFVSVPLYHSFGFGRVRVVLGLGGTLVLRGGPMNAAAMVAAIEQHNVNSLAIVPAGLAIFQGRLAAMLERVGPRMLHVELGSAFMSEAKKAELCRIFPNARLCMHYGLTEASRSTFLEFHSEPSKLATVGRATPNVRIVVVDDRGQPCAPLVEGEVLIYGAHLFTEYFGDAERNRAAWTKDGGFRTGDFGFLDSDGYLHLRGRKDEMINKGGVKISPEELESALALVLTDVDFCVVGMPDPDGIAGTIPVVVHTGPELALAELTPRLAAYVDKSKLPDRILRIDTIFRTQNGKPQRKLVAEEVARRWPTLGA